MVLTALDSCVNLDLSQDLHQTNCHICSVVVSTNRYVAAPSFELTTLNSGIDFYLNFELRGLSVTLASKETNVHTSNSILIFKLLSFSPTFAGLSLMRDWWTGTMRRPLTSWGGISGAGAWGGC